MNCLLGWTHWKHVCAVLRTKRKVKNGASIRFRFQILLHIPNSLQMVM